MDNESNDNKIKINNDINIPISNEELNNIQNNNIDINENNNINSQPKLKLKKKVNKLKMPPENNNNQEEQVPIPNIEIDVMNDQVIETNNIVINNDNNIEIKIEENEDKKNDNKGYLDDDLEDEDNKKLYLRVIKRMEKTYGVPVIAAKIEGEPIKDIGLEENIRPILIGKDLENKKYINNNRYEVNKYKNMNNNNNNYKNKENIINNIINNNSYNIPSNIKINNYINNFTNKDKRQYNNNYMYNINLMNSQNLNYNYNINYRPREYIFNPKINNKNFYNNDFQKRYGYSAGKNTNNINSRIIPNKQSSINKPRKYSDERIDVNFQKRLNNKYPIFKPNRIDFGNYNFNYKNLKYNSLGNAHPIYSNLNNLNQRKYNYPLKKTYYISYNNRYAPYSNLSNTKSNKFKNYFNINLNNNRTPIVPKTNFKYFNSYKNKNINVNNSNQLYMNDFGKNKNKSISVNKSQNIPRGKNGFYNYTGYLNKYNYGRNNGNLLSLTQNMLGNSNKKLNITPFRSYNNYNLNFNYANEDNINNEYHPEIQMPMKEKKFTYYINSRYN